MEPLEKKPVFSKAKARGLVIEELNRIESSINRVIVNHFKPSDKREFERIILNSSILNFGGKIKILRNIPSFEKKIIEEIQKLSNIRNGFAHCIDHTSVMIYLDKNRKPTSLKSEDVLEVMNSSGVLKVKRFHEYLEEFNKSFEIVNNYIKKYNQEH